MQKGTRVVESGLHRGDDVERVLGGVHVQQVHGRQGEGRQRLVEGEVIGQVDGQAQPGAPVGCRLRTGGVGEDPGGAQ